MSPTQSRAGFPARRSVGRVLVIDDEPAVALGLRRALRGCALSAAGSVDEAIALLAAGQDFDLVICDVMMPGRLGTELLGWARREHPALLERLVMMTGGVRDPRVRRDLEEAGVPLLSKPFEAASVLRLLDERVRRAAA
jgi:CheY-like chemotaxis protein